MNLVSSKRLVRTVTEVKLYWDQIKTKEAHKKGALAYEGLNILL